MAKQHRRAKLNIKTRRDGLYDWELVAANGREVCGSNQGYESRARAVEMADRVIGGGYKDARR